MLVIGSGPIIIGQAAEFDYAGTQACKALREEGKRVILVNSNPATIMTDEGVADVTYIEPLTVEVLRRVIGRETPDGLLATLGGQTGLNLAVALAEAGVLEEIRRRDCWARRSPPSSRPRIASSSSSCFWTWAWRSPPSQTVTTLEDALDFAGDYRPAGGRPPGLHARRHRRRRRPHPRRACAHRRIRPRRQPDRPGPGRAVSAGAGRRSSTR